MKTILIGLVAMIGGGLIFGAGGKGTEGIALTVLGFGIIIGRIGGELGKQ